MPSPTRPILRRIFQIAALLLSLSMAAFYIVRSQRQAGGKQDSSPAAEEFTVVQSTKRAPISMVTGQPAAEGAIPAATSETNQLELDSKHLDKFEGFINYGTPIKTEATAANGKPATVIFGTKSISQPVFSTKKVKEQEEATPSAAPAATEPPVIVPAPQPSPP